MALELAKGTKDISGEGEILKQEILSSLKKTFELYGFNPLNTTVLERLDTLTSKYAGGEEITREIFKLKDQGGRELGLRYDLTVPFARFVGMNKEIKMPFKRYEMGVVFRDGPIKLGRYREFWQCDVDVVGSSSMLAEAEILNLTKEFFESLNFDIIIRVNNRKIIDGIMQICDIPEELRMRTILTIDKLEKLGKEDIKKELVENGLNETEIAKLFKFVLFKGNNKEKLNLIRTELKNNEGIKEVTELIDYCGFVDFDISLARGLAYYTGTVFEVFLKNSEIKSSVAAGGRYDAMIGKFIGTAQSYPAVGIAFGLSAIIDALKLAKKESVKKTVTKCYVIPIGTQQQCLQLAEKLRKAGINTEVDINNKSASKNLDYANYYKIPYVIIIGEDELKKQKFKLKDMNSGKEEFFDEKALIKKLR